MGLSKLLYSSRYFPRSITETRILSRTYSSAKPTEADECQPGGDKKLDGSKKGLVIGVYENESKFELTPAAQEINQKSGGKICQHLNEFACSLKLGKAFIVTDLVPEYSAIAVTSLGCRQAGYNQLEGLDQARVRFMPPHENIRWGVGAAVSKLIKRGCGSIDVDPAGAPDAAAEAAYLAAWRFQEFKSCEDREPTATVAQYGGISAEWNEGSIRGDAQNWARFLSDMPANKMAPVDLATAALNVLCPLGIKVEAHDRTWIENQKMEAFLTVARGSCETPIFLECTYTGGKNTRPPVLIAAKGVTFDSGGLCLKTRQEMTENRGSMAGAAVSLAALKAIALLKVPLNVSCVIPLCENMVSGQCMKVGDVVRALNGLSIEIEDTDMEGRLMMADALVYGQSVHKPSLVVDVATFTHGVLLATGGGAFGCFSNNEAAWRGVRSAGSVSGDRPWRFPLWNYYGGQLTNDSAVDLRNKGSGRATPCLGAAFLRNFICGDWVHMDITGVGKLGHLPSPPYLDPRRMTGRPTRTLVHFLDDVAKACLKEKKPKEAAAK